MRIALFADTFLPQVNGIVVAVTELAKAMAERGHKVFILAPRYGNPAEFSYPNVTVARFASVPALVYGGFRMVLPNPSIFKFVRKNRIDVMHVHAPMGLGLQAAFLSKLLKLPLVGTFHTFFAHREYLKHAKLDYPFAEGVAWGFSNAFYSNCTIVTCPSQEVLKEMRVHGCKAAVKILPYGIDASNFDSSKSPAIKRKHGNKLALFVGRFAHEKNILSLLESFALASKKLANIKLLMVGSGPQLRAVKKKIRELKLAGKVVLLGQMGHEELAKSGIFGACSVFINASVTETGPIALLEAQANGLVCVTVKGKGMPIVKHNRNGLVVEPDSLSDFADSIVKLFTEKTLYSELRKNALSDIKNYDMKRIARVWEETYQEAMAKLK